MNLRRHLAIAITLVALIAAACGGTSDNAADDIVDAVDEPTETTEAPVEETTTTTEAEPEPEPEAEETTTTAEPAGEIDGMALFERSCSGCHGPTGEGSSRGPSLIGISESVPDQQVSFDQIVNGGGGMPSFGARFSDDEIQAMVDFIYATF